MSRYILDNNIKIRHKCIGAWLDTSHNHSATRPEGRGLITVYIKQGDYTMASGCCDIAERNSLLLRLTASC